MRFIDLMGAVLAVLLASFVAALLIRCTPLPVPVPPDPEPQGGAGPVLSACERAGERLEELGCKDGSGFALADGFADACERNARDGSYWNPELIACVASCADVQAAWEGTYRCP